MRLNIYSQELITDEDYPNFVVEPVMQQADTGVIYSAVRMFLHSAPQLHDTSRDDDRSALTFWLPKSGARREVLARTFDALAEAVRQAPAETGLD